MTPALSWLPVLGLSAAAAELAVLQAEAARHPEDHGGWVALAEAALASGEAELALAAWDRAVALSGGSWESRVGRTLALSALGRHSEAIRSAAALVEDRPESGQAWAVRGWAWRWRPLLPQLSAAEADRSYHRALALDGPADAGCGRGWTRLALGDSHEAHRIFAETDAPCAAAGQAAAALDWELETTFLAGLLRHTDHPWRERGSHQAAQVVLRSDRGMHGGLTLRRLGVTGAVPALEASPPAAGEPPDLTAASLTQGELWLHGGGRLRHVGLDLVVGHAVASGESAGQGTGGAARGWAQLRPLTLGLTGGTIRYDDGAQVTLGADLDLPLMPALALALGTDHTRFTPADAGATPEHGTSIWGAARVQLDRPQLGLSAGGRTGRELRPLRLAQPSLWNLDLPLTRSAFAQLWWDLHPRVTALAGAERVGLAAPPSTPESPTPTSESTLTTAHLGLMLRAAPRSQEQP